MTHPNEATRDNFNTTRTFVAPEFKPRYDPLTLDLDGDGLETTGVDQSTVYFDNNADGIKTKTGWIKPDDGLLVFDRNGNGVIDNGRELFGDSMPLPNGGLASDGLAALAAEDTNGDGKVDSQDAHWGSLRIWQDFNQDGVSQADELFTLDQKGIVALNTARTFNSQLDANGNQIGDLGSYVKANGATGTLGGADGASQGSLADINLGEDTFYRQFTDHIAIRDDVKDLPDMQGSGLVRDLREAASLDNATGDKLRQLLAQYQAATTKAAQEALLDQMIDAWAETAGVQFGTLLTQAQNKVAGHPEMTVGLTTAEDRLITLAATFNGVSTETIGNQLLQNIPTSWSWTRDSAGNMVPTSIQYKVGLYQQQHDSLQKSVDALRQSVYDSLLLQTRLKPVMDAIELKIDDSGLKLDFSHVAQILADRVQANGANGLIDMVEFTRVTKDWSMDAGWDGYPRIVETARTIPMTAELDAVCKQFSLYIGTAGSDSINGSVNNDTLAGEGGNDTLYGGAGNDTYFLAKGDGYDTISDYDPTAGNTDVVRFLNVASTEIISLERRSFDLLLKYGATDQLTVSNYFSNSSYLVEQFQFSDGITWDQTAIKARVITYGTAAADTISGYADGPNRTYGFDGNDYITGGSQADLLDGGNGNDSLYGNAGNDSLDGGAGNDMLDGSAGDDNLIGGTGDDYIGGGAGSDMINGGIGNDTLYGDAGNNTYVLAKGDGYDTISDYDPTAGNTDVVRFLDVASTDVTSLERKGNNLVLKYGATDQLTVSSYFSTWAYLVEQFEFSDGVTWDATAIKARVITYGTTAADTISGYADGPNRTYGFDGNDYITGGSQADLLDGGNGNDSLYGNAGNDIMQGGLGIDTLNDTAGNNLFDGGMDNDTLIGGTGNELFIGGAGNDTITTGTGSDIIAFNRGDGQDTVIASTGKDNTLSLGKGIKYADLLFTKTGNDLTLSTGVSEQVTFKDWYANTNNHSVANLQMVIEGTTDYDPASTNAINNKKVEQFNFDGLVTAFDQARAANASLTNWSLSSALLNFHLGGSDSAAIGGDLVYLYAKDGNLSGISVTPAQAILASSQFGSANQNLQSVSALQNSSPRLM